MRIPLLAVMVASITIACNAQPKALSVKPTTKKDSVSYAIGANIGKSMKMQKLDLNAELIAAGLRDALQDTSLYTEEQVKSILMAFQGEMQAKQQEERDKQGAEGAKVAQEFLAKNKTQPGVMVTASGLQYKVVKEGTGPKPTQQDQVRVHYSGTLIDGTKFDSSYDRGAPVDFGVTQVIKGWTEALMMMPVGSKYMLYIPPELAYGASGKGDKIGPNQALIFEVELLEIIK